MRLKLSLTASPEGDGDQLQEYIFDDRGGTIGRGDDCSWRLSCPDKLISRRHAAVTFEAGGYCLYDASSNGVYVNDSPEPLGQGGSHAIKDGDVLRMGDFVMSAALLDVPETRAPSSQASAPEPQNAATDERSEMVADVGPAMARPRHTERQPSPEPLDAQRRVSSIRPATLGHPNESFTPPAAHIPEDWDLNVDDIGADNGGERSGSVARMLDALDPATTRALLEGMGIDPDESEELQIEPNTARALGRVIRDCLDGAFAMRAEFAAVEREVTGAGSGADQTPTVAGFADPGSLLLALAREHDRVALDAIADDVQGAFAQLRGRHKKAVNVLAESVGTVIEQFSPHKTEERVRRRVAEPTGFGGFFVRMWRRGRFMLSRRAECWRLYSEWYESQGGDAHRALRTLFEKKATALYARELKPVGQNGGKPDSRRGGKRASNASVNSGVQG